MKKLSIFLAACAFTMLTNLSLAQERGTEGTSNLLTQLTRERGQVWGSVTSDIAYKANADTVNGGRGDGNQYATMPVNTGQFQLRRAMLGYDFRINRHFSAEVLIAAENHYAVIFDGGKNPITINNFNPYIRLANVRWNDIFLNSDLIIGQMYTPAFAGNTETLWGYRSIEKTMTEMYGTPVSDLGISLRGCLPENENFGYNLMVGTGNNADLFHAGNKTLYGEVFYKLYGQRIIIDLYGDYSRMNSTQNWLHTRQMTKVSLAYSVPKFTLGVEAFANTLKGDNVAVRGVEGILDTIDTKSIGYSVFMRARIWERKLGVFARYDNFTAGLNNDDKFYASYSNMNYYYNPNIARQFVTFGLDYSPTKHLKIMPNVWYCDYSSTHAATTGKLNLGNDLVYRLTVSYTYGR